MSIVKKMLLKIKLKSEHLILSSFFLLGLILGLIGLELIVPGSYWNFKYQLESGFNSDNIQSIILPKAGNIVSDNISRLLPISQIAQKLTVTKKNTLIAAEYISPGIVPVKQSITPVSIQPVISQALNICKDANCMYYPIDKTYVLSPNYIPAIINTGLPGGNKLSPVAVGPLSELFAAAHKVGLNPIIYSGYRSYSEQSALFNSIVNQNIAKGYNQQQAIQLANYHSALPGHSEHQLGLAADVGCVGCSYLDQTSSSNNTVWQFLQANAHKYGFVISYPINSEALTGYMYEPWHIRYIGVNLATELYNEGYLTGNGKYLSQFLILKKLYT